MDDFFVCDFAGVSPKHDLASMEHPLFSLATRPDRRILRYTHNDVEITVTPSVRGRATIFDADVLIFCISQLMAALNAGRAVSRTLTLTAHDLLLATGRETGGDSYRRLREAFERLAGTRICETFETELRGKDMVSGWTGADADTLQRWLRLVCERHAAVRFVFECQAPAARRSIAYECLLLPLFHTSQRVDRILGAMAPLDAPDWAGPLDLGPPSISDFEVVWPDGAPRRVGEPCEPVPFVPSHAGLPSQAGLLSQGGEPSALRPAVRVARIVRQDRRQFRVYDGGRG